MSEWRDMSSAPRDGSPILLSLVEPLDSNDVANFVAWKDISVSVGWWSAWGGDTGEWDLCIGSDANDSHSSYVIPITLRVDQVNGWMPLPKALVAPDALPDETEPKLVVKLMAAGNDVICPVGGMYVVFPRPMPTVPSLATCGLGMKSGDRSVISDKSGFGFHIAFRNARGRPISRAFDFMAMEA